MEMVALPVRSGTSAASFLAFYFPLEGLPQQITSADWERASSDLAARYPELAEAVVRVLNEIAAIEEEGPEPPPPFPKGV